MAMFPGFPEFSEKIDMPDIAELLSYPMFRVAEAETVMKYGSDFQRYVLDKMPLKNDKKHVTVYSSVHLIHHGIRPITTGTTNPNIKEWHVDGLETEPYEHINPTDRVHLLLGHTSFPTVFNAEPLEIPNAEYMDIRTFNKYLAFNDVGVKERFAETGRIYTFTNHIHRAQNPTRLEFRFSFRVRETNRVDIPPLEYQSPLVNRLFDANLGDWSQNIEREGNKVSVYFPQTLTK